ncbi:MAG: NAD(P)H-dependent oxidoreductase [Neisseria sp.]|nr:NAD(P)H-dependent oxidoreductase [Neisseria sp.]
MINKSDILNAYLNRHACKAYDPNKKIADDDFRFILETGRLSPSSFGFEPWKFLVIENPKIKQLIRENAWGAKDKIADCSHFVLIVVRNGQEMAADGEHIKRLLHDVHQFPAEIIEMRREMYRQFAAEDFALVDNERAYYDWACKQSYIALGNMLTTAAMLGIDSTPIEGFPLEKMHALFSENGVYDGNKFKISVMAAFGYRLNEPRAKTRQKFDEVVEFI